MSGHAHPKNDEIRKGPYISERTVADRNVKNPHIKDPESNPPPEYNLRKENINVQPPAAATHPDEKGLWDYRELRQNAVLPGEQYVVGLTMF